MSSVQAVRRNKDGDLIGFKLDDGRELSFEQCQSAIHNGELPDLICTNGKNGTTVIRSIPDGSLMNNLSAMPEF